MAKFGSRSDGPLEEGDGGGGIALSRHGFPSQAVGLKGFERGRGGLLERRIELLHRAERFAQLARAASPPPHRASGGPAPSRRGHLLSRQRVPAAAVQGFQSNHILRFPDAAIEPSRYALLPARWHTSRARSG